MSKKRIVYIDILRAIAIILVVLGHINVNYLPDGLHKWAYAFSIPLFFFISGITLSFINYQKADFKSLLKKRLIRIYLPFLIWGLILSVFKFNLWTIPQILYGTHHSLNAATNSSLWFLPVLFLGYIILDAILLFLSRKKLLKKLPIAFIFFLLLSLIIPSQLTIHNILGHNLPMGIDIVPMTIVFMLLGYFYQTKLTSINKISSKSFLPIVIISLIVSIIFSIINPTDFVMMAENRYGNYLYFFIAAISGIILSIISAIVIDRRTKKPAKLLSNIGSDTMAIFILHKYPIIAITRFANILPIAVPIIIFIPASLISSIALCMFVSKVITKYMPFLLGQKS